MPGFPPETLAFLKGIVTDNSREWFTANHALYEATVTAAKTFVESVGPRLREISPTVQFSAKSGASLPRINNDVRNDKSKKPYKENFDLWFWHGDKKGWDQPGF